MICRLTLVVVEMLLLPYTILHAHGFLGMKIHQTAEL